MANDSGLNTTEVQEALAAAATEEDKRYLQRVLDSRGVPKASVNSYEIVAGNPDAYPEETVKQQEDLADGRNAEPTPAADLGVRGSVEAASEEPKKAAAKK